MAPRRPIEDVFRHVAAQTRSAKAAAEVYRYLTPEEMSEMDALKARMDQLKEKNARRAVDAMVDAQQNEVKRRLTFSESERFAAIREYILAQGEGVFQDDVHYFPESYPFTAKEFGDFCSILFERLEDQAESGGSHALVVREGGVRLTLFIGQGSSFYAVKDDGAAPAPEFNRD